MLDFLSGVAEPAIESEREILVSAREGSVCKEAG